MTSTVSRIRQRIIWWLEPARSAALALSFAPLFLLLTFLRVHGENIVWSDQVRIIDFVMALRRGEYQYFRELFHNFGGQYNVFPYLVSFLTVLITRWNLWVEIAVNVILAAITLIVLIKLLSKARPEAIYALPAFALLVFSVHQDINWLNAFVGHWFYSNLFVLLGLLVIFSRPGDWKALAAAAALALAATYTSANGATAWLVMGAALPFAGFRKWTQPGAWAVGTIAAFAIAINMAGGRVGAQSFDPLKLISFGIRFLGAPFISRYPLNLHELQLPALALGVVGVVMLIANALYVWRKAGDLKSAALWLAVAAYGAGAGLLVGLSRISGGMYEYGPFISWYATMSNMFWYGYLALALIVIWNNSPTAAHTDRYILLGTLNTVVLGGLLGLYILQYQRVEATSYTGPDVDSHGAGTPITDNCAREYVFTLDGRCLAEWESSTDWMAAYKLNVFAGVQPINILPDDYRRGEPVIVETASMFQSVHLRDWSLSGVGGDSLIFVYPGDDPRIEEIDKLPDPLLNTISETGAANMNRLREFITRGDVFWTLRKADSPSQLEAFLAEMVAEGYEPTGEYPHDPGGFVMIRYEQDR